MLETERATALTAIGLAIGRDPPTITLSEVAAHATPQAGATLFEAGMVLRAQAVALRGANERNARLLQGCRSLVAASLAYDAGDARNSGRRATVRPSKTRGPRAPRTDWRAACWTGRRRSRA